MNLVKNKVLRTSIFIGGCMALLLGFIGIFVPLLPTTPFVLLAAWCFFRSSKKAHDWIYRHPLFGKPLTDWEKNRSISPTAKVLAVSTILLSILVIWQKVHIEWIRISVTAVMVCVSVFILTRKNSV